MNLKPDQKRVKDLLIDTIASLCRDGLTYSDNLNIHGVIGITVDQSEVFLVHINQEITASGDDDNAGEFNKELPSKILVQGFSSNHSIASNSTSNSQTHNAPHKQVKSEPRSPKSQSNAFNSPNYEQYSTFYSPGYEAQNMKSNKMIKLEDSFDHNQSQSSICNKHHINNNDQNDSEPHNHSSNNYYNNNSANTTNHNANSYYNNSQQQEQHASGYYPPHMMPMSAPGQRRVNRRRGGRRGGSSIGRHSIPNNRGADGYGGNNNNTSWEAMVATTFVCKVCGQTFVHKSNLLGHQIRIHGRQKNKRGRPPTQQQQQNNNNNIICHQQQYKTDLANLHAMEPIHPNSLRPNNNNMDENMAGVAVSMHGDGGGGGGEDDEEGMPEGDGVVVGDDDDDLMIDHSMRGGKGGVVRGVSVTPGDKVKNVVYVGDDDYDSYPPNNDPVNNNSNNMIFTNNNTPNVYMPSSAAIIHNHSSDSLLVQPSNNNNNNNRNNNIASPPTTTTTYPNNNNPASTNHNNNNNNSNFQSNFHHNSPINRSYEMLSNW